MDGWAGRRCVGDDGHLDPAQPLALASYGDMDVSVLDEKPAGRKPIKTALISTARMDEVTAHLGRAAEGKCTEGHNIR